MTARAAVAFVVTLLFIRPAPGPLPVEAGETGHSSVRRRRRAGPANRGWSMVLRQSPYGVFHDIVRDELGIARRAREERPMPAALIVIDVLNPYQHGDAEALKGSVRQVLPAIEALIRQADEMNVPVVYVNDNYEDWSAGREEIVNQALEGTAPELVRPIVPGPGTAFVVKARHSIFCQTPRSTCCGRSGSID